jgi:hypothetical protein
LKRAVFSVYTDVFMMKTYSVLRRTVARLWRNGCTTYTRVVAPQKEIISVSAREKEGQLQRAL